MNRIPPNNEPLKPDQHMDLIDLSDTSEGQQWLKDNLASVEERLNPEITREMIIGRFLSVIKAIGITKQKRSPMNEFIKLTQEHLKAALPDLPEKAVKFLISYSVYIITTLIQEHPEELNAITEKLGGVSFDRAEYIKKT